jgi:hypothetical protein
MPPTRPPRQALTSDKAPYVTFMGLDFARLAAIWPRNPAYLLR